jgi:hypothetical protein
LRLNRVETTRGEGQKAKGGKTVGNGSKGIQFKAKSHKPKAESEYSLSLKLQAARNTASRFTINLEPGT